MQKGDAHPAYKAVMQLSKPKCHPGRQLRHETSGRQLHTPSKRITEWLRHVTQLFTATSPIAPVVLVLILPCPPPQTPTPTPPPTSPPPPHHSDPHPHLQSDPPTQKSRWLRLSPPSNASKTKSPGVCNILPEMLKCGGNSVHSTLYRFMHGIWRIEQVPPGLRV